MTLPVDWLMVILLPAPIEVTIPVRAFPSPVNVDAETFPDAVTL